MKLQIWANILNDPFRLFFPLGALFSFVGIVPWITAGFATAAYPVELHKIVMMNGFLLSFVCGFLMTAIPRFTGAGEARSLEVISVFLLLILSLANVLLERHGFCYLWAAITLLFLIRFAAVRFLKKTSNPPHTFLFIGLGLALWSLVNFVKMFSHWNLLSTIGQLSLGGGISTVVDDLFTNGVVMSLVLGVGGRLIPGILGWQEIVSQQKSHYEKAESFFGSVPKGIWISGLIFLLSFLLRPVLPLWLCMALRASVTAYFALFYWQIYRLPPNRGYLSLSLWVTCWFLVAGYVLPILWPESGVHGMHLLFIAGFSLLTLLISLRVSFAHSSIGTSIESSTWVIALLCGLLLAAALTRITAFLWPKIYFTHLSYAAATWLMGMTIWIKLVFQAYRSPPLNESPKGSSK